MSGWLLLDLSWHENAEFTDLAIVGAGAAGLMAAIQAAYKRKEIYKKETARPKISLFDSRKKIGAKILISGGTRCNVTNVRVREADYWGASRHYVRHVFQAYSSDQTINFFKKIGVSLVLEPSGKYFPQTHSGKTVLEALIKETQINNADLVTDFKVIGIEKEKDFFLITGSSAAENAKKRIVRSKKVILCSGGLSLPETGSDGSGLGIARKLGHNIVPTFPALTPFKSDGQFWSDLSGLSFKVRLDFYLKGKKKAESKGDFLFTHEGFSGPACLDISRHYAVADKQDKPEVRICFLPSGSEYGLSQELKLISGGAGAVFRFMNQKHGLPRRFAEKMIQRCGWEDEVVLPENWRSVLIQNLMNYPLEISGVIGYRKAEVTAGGVDLKEVSVSTMESKKVKGLFFAGEILDVDGRIGGFNFQWSWSSGAIAGKSAMASIFSDQAAS